MNNLIVKYDSPEVEKMAKLKLAMEGDAGYDLYNASPSTITIAPGCSAQVPAGISIKIPDGYCGLIVARSSTFFRRKLLVVHGLIDSGYVGPLFTFVYHPAMDQMPEMERKDRLVLIEPWERLSQLILMKVPVVEVLTCLGDLPTTSRGQQGFGSTGN